MERRSYGCFQVAVLVTKTPSLSDVIKDIRHLINIRSLILYLSRQQFSQAKRKKNTEQIVSIFRRTLKRINFLLLKLRNIFVDRRTMTIEES